jgi:2-acetylphloroglucinol acetyltransferase
VSSRTGIVSYGFSFPKRRLKVEETISTWKNAPVELIRDAFDVKERGVLGADEDVITLSVDAAKMALTKWGGDKTLVDSLYLGTCTNPYDSKPSGTVIVEALGLGREVKCADIQFSTKSGTTALQLGQAMVSAGLSRHAIAIGADTLNRHVSPGDSQEAWAGAGAAAVLIGNTDTIAEIDGIASYVSDLPDSFRVQGERYIRTGTPLGSSRNEISIEEHTSRVTQMILKQLQCEVQDFNHVVFQQATGSSPFSQGRALGFVPEQVEAAVFASAIGDTGSASALIGLAKVLEVASPGDRILVISYGFGAGSDAMSLKVTDQIARVRSKGVTVQSVLDDKIYVSYAEAMKYEFKYIRQEYPLTAWL